MTISFLGGSTFQLKTKQGTVLVGPVYKAEKGSLPAADIVVYAEYDQPSMSYLGTTKTPDPFVIMAPGEFEVQGISVFVRRVGEKALLSMIHAEDVSVAYFSTIAQEPDEAMLETLGNIDVLLLPIGGNGEMLDAKSAIKVMREVDPYYVVPMGYNGAAGLQEFLTSYGISPPPVAQLNVTSSSMPEETQLVVLSA